ncbi:MAG: glycosyltransferase family 4 protein [Deltaproteobacteria bacterium]
MRIAYVCADPGVPVFGMKGCSIHVQEVLRALIGRGARVTLFAAREGGEPVDGLAGIALHPLPMPSAGNLAGRERESLAANAALRTALDGEGPFDLVYERYSLWSFAGMEYASAAGIPGVLEVNAPLIDEQATYRGLADLHGAVRVAERAFHSAAAIVAVSQGVADYLDRFPGARGRVHVIPNGVDPGRFPENLPPALPRARGTFTTGFVGTLKAWHGLSHLVEAFDTLHREEPGSRLLVVGTGPERDRLAEDLTRRGLAPAATLTGAVRPEEIPGLLASMDAAVAPYPRREDFYFSPLKVFEYMAAGLPVAASRIGQIERLIRDGEDGILLPPGDSDALASALLRLARDPSLRARLGRAARERARKEFSWATVAERILRAAAPASGRVNAAGQDSPERGIA